MEIAEDLTKEHLIRDLTKLRERINYLEQSDEDKKKYLEEFNRTRAMFEGLFEFAPDAIVVVSRAGDIVRANKQAERLFGYSMDELLKAHLELLLPERFREKHQEHRREYMSAPHIRPMGTGLKLYGEKKDGTEFPVDIALGPLDTGDGMLIIAVIRDVSKRNEAEEQLKQRTLELINAMKDLDAFSYSVSHDLRAPLRHLSGFVALLQKRLVEIPDEKIGMYANAIATASVRMELLINDLLAFSKLGLTKMEKRKIRLQSLVNEAIQEIQYDIKDREIAWEIDELPDVSGDRSMLKLAIINLISNAVKYTRTRPKAEIRIGCKDEGSEFICSVTDNGVGFDMKFVDRLFGVFQRLHTQKEFEGTGVGLANVRRIVSRHGGRTWAEGVLEQGAAFYFSLPKK